MREEITEEQFAIETLERYSGCEVAKFQSNLLLTNFPRHVEYFAKSRSVPVIEGSMFKVAHCPAEDISILDFKIGSPAAALVVDLCSFLPIKASLLSGSLASALSIHPAIAKAWVTFSGVSGKVYEGFNILSVHKKTTGFYSIAFIIPMANTMYVPIAIAEGFNVQASPTLLKTHTLEIETKIFETCTQTFAYDRSLNKKKTNSLRQESFVSVCLLIQLQISP